MKIFLQKYRSCSICTRIRTVIMKEIIPVTCMSPWAALASAVQPSSMIWWPKELQTASVPPPHQLVLPCIRWDSANKSAVGLSPLKGFLASLALKFVCHPQSYNWGLHVPHILLSNTPRAFKPQSVSVCRDTNYVNGWRQSGRQLFLSKLCPSWRILGFLTAVLAQLFQKAALRNGIRPLRELSFKCIYQSEVILNKPQCTYALIPCLAKQCKRFSSANKPEFSKNKSSRINPSHSQHHSPAGKMLNLHQCFGSEEIFSKQQYHSSNVFCSGNVLPWCLYSHRRPFNNGNVLIPLTLSLKFSHRGWRILFFTWLFHLKENKAGHNGWLVTYC